MEFDHYKRVKQEQILELQDQLEKMEDIEKELEKYPVTQSMSRKGNCWDNAVAENYFKILKLLKLLKLL